jgi:hypothetical protein
MDDISELCGLDGNDFDDVGSSDEDEAPAVSLAVLKAIQMRDEANRLKSKKRKEKKSAKKARVPCCLRGYFVVNGNSMWLPEYHTVIKGALPVPTDLFSCDNSLEKKASSLEKNIADMLASQQLKETEKLLNGAETDAAVIRAARLAWFAVMLLPSDDCLLLRSICVLLSCLHKLSETSQRRANEAVSLALVAIKLAAEPRWLQGGVVKDHGGSGTCHRLISQLHRMLLVSAAVMATAGMVCMQYNPPYYRYGVHAIQSRYGVHAIQSTLLINQSNCRSATGKQKGSR